MTAHLTDATVIAPPLDFSPKAGDRVDVIFWSGDGLRGTIENDGRIVLDPYSVRQPTRQGCER